MKEDDEADNDQDVSGLLNKLKLYLMNYYEPVQDPKDAELHFSTNDVWLQLLKLYPNEIILTRELVAVWLHNAGFTFYDYGEMRFEWMMRKV